MSFQAYLDNIKAQTGKTPADFKILAEKKGLLKPDVKAGQIIAWLKEDFGLGYGHAMAIYGTLHSDETPVLSIEEKIAKHFTGEKSAWRPVFDQLLAEVKKFGPNVTLATTDSYISLLKSEKKFGIIAITANRFDIGIKLKGVEPTSRLTNAGSWNTMVTHRVSLHDQKELNTELIGWLRQAYDKT